MGGGGGRKSMRINIDIFLARLSPGKWPEVRGPAIALMANLASREDDGIKIARANRLGTNYWRYKSDKLSFRFRVITARPYRYTQGNSLTRL